MPFALRLAVSRAVDALALALTAWVFSGVTVGGSASTLVVAALVFALLTHEIVGGFRIHGFWTLAGATVVVWAVGAAAGHWLFPRKRGRGGRLRRLAART